MRSIGKDHARRAPRGVTVAAFAFAVATGALLAGAVSVVALDATGASPAAIVTGTQTGCYVTRSGWDVNEPGALPVMGRGHLVRCLHHSDDPRVDGMVDVLLNGDFYDSTETTGPMWLNWEVQPEDGSGPWQGRGFGFLDDVGVQRGFAVATGSGANEGLTWVLVFDVQASGHGKTTGVIYEGEPPHGFPVELMSVPEPPTDEG